MLSAQESNRSSTTWENPFKSETYYQITPSKTVRNQKIFEVKGKKIKALFDWEDKKAPFGMIVTKKEYGHYNLELKYKWGKRKFEPRAKEKRDAGILFHIQKNRNEIWPSSLECQIQEGDTGDLWVIKGPKVSVVLEDGTTKFIDSSRKQKYLRNIKFNNYENKGWNLVRLEVRGSESAKFYVNGHLVNEIKDFLTDDDSPLAKGSILLQAEGAEITYKNIRIQELASKK